ncbi:hypothetical protein WJX75_007092 [Coccomyxa subellipsoidea]|uniref:Uncharacterized protein n=1 Tax=Coccomyxa subellipsoidea TaxID=248742 RepID=A0ABR2YJM5_9CHLO
MGQVDAARLLQVLPGSTSGSSSILGSSGGLGTSLGATGGDQSGSSSGSLLSAVQSGSINSSPPPGGLIGLQSPPPSSAMPQLNWNPSGNSFNSGTGRRMHAHA